MLSRNGVGRVGQASTIRKERGWSKEQLAFKSGLHRTYIGGIERGAGNPTIDILAKLTSMLRIGVEERVKRTASEIH